MWTLLGPCAGHHIGVHVLPDTVITEASLQLFYSAAQVRTHSAPGSPQPMSCIGHRPSILLRGQADRTTRGFGAKQ